MSLSQRIAAAVDSFDPNFGGASLIEVSSDPLQMSLDIESTSRIAVSLRRLSFRDISMQEPGFEQLQEFARQVERRVTYLMEPLAVLESDSIARHLLLRSHSLTRRGEHLYFYEAQVRSEFSVTLVRVRFESRSRRRELASLTLTHETLERLVDDLVDSALSAVRSVKAD